MIRTFKVSDQWLQGFEVIIPDLTNHDGLTHCTNYVINELKTVLKNLRMTNLVEYVDKQVWHMHEEWQEILDNPDRIFWVCNH